MKQLQIKGKGSLEQSKAKARRRLTQLRIQQNNSSVEYVKAMKRLPFI